MGTEFEKAEYLAKNRLAFAKIFVEPVIKKAANDDNAEGLLPNHIFLLRDTSKFRAVVKCRKTAQSWGYALASLATAATEDSSTTIIGSYNKRESKEKRHFLGIQYKAICDYAPRLIHELGMTDGSDEVRFNNGSRIIFMPGSPPTGAGAYIKWDEFSIEPQGHSCTEILTAAIGCTTHTGSVDIGGTQRGPDTIFNQIITGKFSSALDDDPFFAGLSIPSWTVREFPWWTSPALCKDVEAATILAPSMSTEERVTKFGNERLLEQFYGYLTTPDQGIDLFQREFEMKVLDDRESYYPYELIKSCYSEPSYWFKHVEVDGRKYKQDPSCLKEAKEAIDALFFAIRSGELRGSEWGWAMDVGRHNDKDEFWIGRSDPLIRDKVYPHVNIGTSLLEFDGKEELVDYIMRSIPVSRGYIDGTRGSVGVQLAERANQRYGQRASIFLFTQSSKQRIASSLKARMQYRKIILPRKTSKFSKLEDQLVKMKKEEKPGGAILFDIARSGQEHGDACWSLCMFSDLFDMPAQWTPRSSVVIPPSNRVITARPISMGRR